MTDRNEALVREAYEAYGRGDVAGMLEFVDPELEWTYLNPGFENPEHETCHGRDQLQLALERQGERGLASQIEEIVASGDKVMVVIRTPGIDRVRVRQADDRNYLVLTLRQGRIIGMRACRDRDEARLRWLYLTGAAVSGISQRGMLVSAGPAGIAAWLWPDALRVPATVSLRTSRVPGATAPFIPVQGGGNRPGLQHGIGSEEHTSELQSPC